MISLDETLQRLGPQQPLTVLPAPEFNGESAPDEPRNIMLGAEEMRRHMADAGWQLQLGLKEAGYVLCGYKLSFDSVDVPHILGCTKPTTVVVQDKREWEGLTARFGRNHRNVAMRYKDIDCLAKRNDLFKLTVLKDAQQRCGYHRRSADEMMVHAWIVYYHPSIVAHVAPFVRLKHCIRTYHTVNPAHVPATNQHIRRKTVLLCGALSNSYPLRKRIYTNSHRISCLEYLPHPHYHCKGCITPQFLQTLAKYKVVICTASRYGYALRKIIEASACGCRVVTDLPVQDWLPHIDHNLHRVHPDIALDDLNEQVQELAATYDPIEQQEVARLTCDYYDYRAAGIRLADDIEKLRAFYTT